MDHLSVDPDSPDLKTAIQNDSNLSDEAVSETMRVFLCFFKSEIPIINWGGQQYFFSEKRECVFFFFFFFFWLHICNAVQSGCLFTTNNVQHSFDGIGTDFFSLTAQKIVQSVMLSFTPSKSVTQCFVHGVNYDCQSLFNVDTNVVQNSVEKSILR